MRKKLLQFGLLLAIVLLFSACAESNSLQNQVDQAGQIAGFWGGLWNGITAPFSFVGSLFSDDIGIYNGHNNGHWYDFGFVIGIMATPASIIKYTREKKSCSC